MDDTVCMGTLSDDITKAAQLICNADGLIVSAGAGMGVDSGLPDFRGNQGFWRNYPALKEAGITFQEMASPSHFRELPRLAWGFYGHRLALYRKTEPHLGFQILRQIAAKMPNHAFVFTSNVDGQFQKAGFLDQQVFECHGSIHYLQCVDGCQKEIWDAKDFVPQVDTTQCQLLNEPPKCPYCGDIVRPNVLMFNDWDWLEARSEQQRNRLDAWLGKVKNPVVIELGAGKAIPTVRYFGESLRVALIRINLRQADMHSASNHVSLPMGALDALVGLQLALQDSGYFGD